MQYDIFISYRRDGGFETAKHLNDLLVRDGYIVSFDIDTLRSGDFDTQLLSRIDQCKDFILIVDQHAFDRTLDPSFNPKNDWLRCELAYALKKDKNIIPIFLSGVKGFPNNLPSDVASVVKKNGPEYNRFYFNDFYKILKKRYLKSYPKSKLPRSIFLFLFFFVIVVFAYHFTNSNRESIDDTMILQKSIEERKQHINDDSTKDNELLSIIEKFVSACENNHNAYWDIYGNNRSLKALTKNKEYRDNEYFSCKLTYKGILYYRSTPLSTYDSGEPVEWEVVLAGSNACPFMLEISPDSENWAPCGEEMHEIAKEIAKQLNFSFLRERKIIGSYSILYEKGNLYYLISETEGSAGATIVLRIILEDIDAVKEFEISEQEVKEDQDFRKKYN